MKNSILFFLLLIPAFLFAQYPNTGNKARLGYQTTGDGLIWRGVAADTVLKPRVIAHAYFQLDTVNGILRRYIATNGSWQVVGGGSDTDSTIYATRYWTSSNFFPLEGGTLTGTGGAGFIGFPSQVSAPGTPASGLNVYAQGSSFNWKGTDGYERQFASTLTGGRTYTLPDVNGTLALGTGTADRSARWSGTNTLAAGNITDNGTKLQALLPWQFQTYTTAGLPTGVTGYHVYNTTTNGPSWYQGLRWAYGLESTFNRGTATRVPFFDANGQVTDDADNYYNSTTNQLNVGIFAADPANTHTFQFTKGAGVIHSIGPTYLAPNIGNGLSIRRGSTEFMRLMENDDLRLTSSITRVTLGTHMWERTADATMTLGLAGGGSAFNGAFNFYTRQGNAASNILRFGADANNNAEIRTSMTYAPNASTMEFRLMSAGVITERVKFTNSGIFTNITGGTLINGAYTGTASVGIAIGGTINATNSSESPIAIGAGSSVTASRGIAIGLSATAANGVAIGRESVAATNEFVMGSRPNNSNGLQITALRFGPDASTSSVGFFRSISQGAAFGANQTGGSLGIYVGAGTGAARPGSFALFTPALLAAGSTVQSTWTPKFILDGQTQQFQLGPTTTAGASALDLSNVNLLGSRPFPVLTTTQRNALAGRVISATFVAAGGSYSTPPTVSITGGGGSGATAVATVQNGGVIAVTIVNQGSGYTSTPTIGFSGGGGGGANFTAVTTNEVDGLGIYNSTLKTYQYYENSTAAWRDFGSYQSGNLGVKTLTPLEDAHIAGDLRVDDSTKLVITPAHTSITGLLTRDATGWVGLATVGAGLSYAAGVLTATGGGNSIYNNLPLGNVTIDADGNSLSISNMGEMTLGGASWEIYADDSETDIYNPEYAEILAGTGAGATFDNATETTTLRGQVNALRESYYEITSTLSPQTFSSSISDNYVNQGGTQASFTFLFPATPADGQILMITWGNAISVVTLDGNGNTITGTAVTTAVAGTRRMFKYYDSSGEWVKIY